jgi:hypothetical protein
MATQFPDEPFDSPPGTSEPDLPDLPVLDETFDFRVAGQEIAQTVVASPYDLAGNISPLPSRERSASHVPWAGATVEDVVSDDDGLSADGFDPGSDEEPDEVQPAPTEETKWKINHARGDHRLDGT